jgi:hypothetical protein
MLRDLQLDIGAASHIAARDKRCSRLRNVGDHALDDMEIPIKDCSRYGISRNEAGSYSIVSGNSFYPLHETTPFVISAFIFT